MSNENHEEPIVFEGILEIDRMPYAYHDWFESTTIRVGSMTVAISRTDYLISDLEKYEGKFVRIEIK